MRYDRELTEALAAAEKAGRYVRAEYDTFVPIPDAPATISTHVDRESQEIILRHLQAAFPTDALVAEEVTPTLTAATRTSDRVWIVDPIDGTRGFAMKNGEFAVMIGLTVGNAVVVGVVLEPETGRATYAAVGGGCWTRVNGGEPTRCRVTETAEVANAVLIQSRHKPGKPSRSSQRLGAKSISETYSAGLKLALVARGEGDVYVNEYSGVHDWDVCAGQILVEEAGGTVTLYDGQPLRYGATGSAQRHGLIASNGRIHAEVVRRLNAK